MLSVSKGLLNTELNENNKSTIVASSLVAIASGTGRSAIDNRLIELCKHEHNPKTVFIVKSILKPVATPPSAYHPFEEGVTVKTGNYYGVVERIRDNNGEPIRIAWWKKGCEDIPWWHKRFKNRKKEFVDRCIDYPVEYLKPLKIEPVPTFIAQKTLLRIKSGTSVVLDSEEIYQFGDNEIFFLAHQEGVSQYHLVRPGEKWIFPALNFPAEPIAYIIELPTRAQLEAAKRTLRIEILVLAKLFLSGIKLEGLLEDIKQGGNKTSNLKASFKASDNMKERDYLNSDFEAAWSEAYGKLIDSAKRSTGIWGYKVGSRMVLSEEYQRYVGGKYQTEYDYLQGTIHDLDLTPASPALIIAWESGNICAYRVEELESNSISPILPLQRIGSSVAYEVSKDGKYYKAFVGFGTKALAKSWWRKLKKELGYVSDPIEAPEEWKPPGWAWKYYCTACKPKQKRMSARIRHLETVAKWNLEERGSRPNHL